MDPSEFCLVNHINGDSRIPLRFCLSCKKAMCVACHAGHKDTCGQISASERLQDEQVDIHSSPIDRGSNGAPPELRSYTDELHDERKTTSMPPRKKLRSAGRKEARYDRDDSQNSDFTKCAFHSANEKYFCISHCLIVCEQCVDESHGTCIVKLVTDTCKDLSHTSVGEYRKWLNKLRIDCIQMKSVLSKNVVGLDGQKMSALKELENEYLKITDRLESEMLEAKTEIIEKHDTHNGELCTNICHINSIVTKLETALNDTKILEGRNLDITLFQKFQQILFGHLDVPSELQSLYNSLNKVKINFKLNRRFQPMSNSSKFGSLCVTSTKCNTDPIPNLNFPFELPKAYEHPRSERRKHSKTYSQTSEPTVTPSVSKPKRTIDSTPFVMDQPQEPIGYTEKGNIQMNIETLQKNFSQEEMTQFSDTDAPNCSDKRSMNTNKSMSTTDFLHAQCSSETSTNVAAIGQTRMSLLDTERDTDFKINRGNNFNNGNAVDFRQNMNKNAINFAFSNFKPQSNQGTNSSEQRNYFTIHTEDERFDKNSHLPLLGNAITNYNASDRGHQDPVSQLLYVSNASMPYSVKDMSVSQARSGNVPIQNFSTTPVPAHGSIFEVIDTDKTKEPYLIPINYSGNNASQPTQNFQPAPNLMSRNIIPTMAMQTNVLFSNNCLFSQNQSSTFHGMSFQNMSARKCSEDNTRVDDDHYYPTIQGLSVTGDGRIILVDQENQRVKMLSHNREKISFLDVYESVYDVTVYNDTTAVVTGHYKLFFIDISGSELRTSKSIKTTFGPRGIQTCNENFLVTCFNWDCKAVKLITENGEVLWSVSEDQEGRRLFSDPGYITCFQDGNQCRVVVSDCGSGTLTVLDGDCGEVIKVCELKGKCPFGVTTDNRGNIYVCYMDTCEIVIWDKDMTNSRMLTNTNGYPLALEFDASRNQLIVSYVDEDYVEIFQLK